MEHTIKLLISSDSVTSVDSLSSEALARVDVRDNPVETIFRNPQLLRQAPPYAVAMIKKELKKFSGKSYKWEKE